MALTVNCPNCGAAVVFRSAALPAVICGYCNSMLARSDDGVGVVGVSAPVPFDMSPVQLGMRGAFDSRGFEAVGRIRWAWTDGSWNEWLLLFDDGSTAWLGDAMGQFMLLRQKPLPRSPILRNTERGRAVPGRRVTIDHQEWTVTDAREVRCTAAGGELPFQPEPGFLLYSVDLKGPGHACASIQTDDVETTFYSGRYVTLAELAPRGLRAFEGWQAPTYAD